MLLTAVTEIHLIQSDVYEFIVAIGFARLILTRTMIDAPVLLLLQNHSNCSNTFCELRVTYTVIRRYRMHRAGILNFPIFLYIFRID